MKLAFLALSLLWFGCASPLHQPLAFPGSRQESKKRPRLSPEEVLRLAAKIPAPTGYARYGPYRREGSPFYLRSLGWWGVHYVPVRPLGIVGDTYGKWIDDSTGQLVRYHYGH